MIMVIPVRKCFSVLLTGYILSGLSICPHAWETWEFIRDNEENNRTCSLSKILANTALTFPQPPGYLGSSIPSSAPSQQNETKWMEDPTLLGNTEGILLFLGRKPEHWTPSVPSPNSIIWIELVFFVLFLPCLVSERNILPWIRETESNQRCLDAVPNVIIFPFTSLTQFIAAHRILLYEAALEKSQHHSLAEIVTH